MPSRATALIVALTFAALTFVGCKRADVHGSGAAGASSAQVPSTAWAKPRAQLLKVGEEAPDFEAIAHTGFRIRLAQFLDKPAVVYFYPQDASPGCTQEAEGIRDQWLKLRDKASMVFGVSGDSSASHREFATAEELPYLLLSDPDFKIAHAFGVPVTEGRVARVTFIIGKNRKVVRVFDQVNPESHAAELMAALDEQK